MLRQFRALWRAPRAASAVILVTGLVLGACAAARSELGGVTPTVESASPQPSASSLSPLPSEVWYAQFDPLWPEAWVDASDQVTIWSIDDARVAIEGQDYELTKVYRGDSEEGGCVEIISWESLRADGSHTTVCTPREYYIVDPETGEWLPEQMGNRHAFVGTDGTRTELLPPVGPLPGDTRLRYGAYVDVVGSVLVGSDSTTDNWYADDWRIFGANFIEGQIWEIARWTEICDSSETSGMATPETRPVLGETMVYWLARTPATPGGTCDLESITVRDQSLFAREIDGTGPIVELAKHVSTYSVVGDTVYFGRDASMTDANLERRVYEIYRRDPDGTEHLVMTGPIPEGYHLGDLNATEQGFAWEVDHPIDYLGDPVDARLYAQLHDGRRFLIWKQTSSAWEFSLSGSRLMWAGQDDGYDQNNPLERIPKDNGQYIADLDTGVILGVPRCEEGCGESIRIAGDYAVWPTRTPSGLIAHNLARLLPGWNQPPS